MQSQNITQSQIETFLQSLLSEGKSNREIAEYRRNLETLYQTVEKNHGKLDQKTLERWRKEQIQKGLSQGTVTNRVVKINHFLRYLKLDELCFPKGGRENLAGKQFGNLLVIEPAEQRSKDRSICWKCRCMICGKEKAIPANQLKKGVQISCGCNRIRQLQETNGYIEGTCLKQVFSDKKSRNNTSGYKGVFQKRGKWAAQIQYKKKVYYLGSYDRIEDAAAARKEAENLVRDEAEKLLERLQETGKKGFREEKL